MDRLKDLFSEIKLIFTGKTLDAIIPPLIFVIINGYFGLTNAIIISLLIALVFFVYRVLSKQSFSYALFGLVGILAPEHGPDNFKIIHVKMHIFRFAFFRVRNDNQSGFTVDVAL